MDVEKASYSMACAVEVIKTFGPKVLPCEGVNLKSSSAFGKDGSINSDVAL
jgi:hypothetical protein